MKYLISHYGKLFSSSFFLLLCGVIFLQVGCATTKKVETQPVTIKSSPIDAKNFDLAKSKSSPSDAKNFDIAKSAALKNSPPLPAAKWMGTEKVASFTTSSGWQYTMGSVDVVLPQNGACLVTCNLDVQSHVQTGYLTFRTARHNVADGTSESDDGWAMDVPVPISQGSASASWTWNMTGGQVYRFGCRTLADRGFLGIPVYPNVSWSCR
ncbi:MAG: hypothetical protein JW943_14810 [Deltaproteobacteria bacterium]|nr:hypothetical protein [Deltaproteobacteria bacterium]